MTIVTSGNKFIDIDGLACVIAYEELLKKKGEETSHYLVNSFTESIPNIVKEFGYEVNTNIPQINDATKFVVTDISDPTFFPEFIKLENVIKIFDHHFGFEKMWQDKLGENAILKEIGACATLIYQEWVKEGMLDSISPISANLLITAILSNSLNFKASVSKEEDKEAFEKLLAYSSLPEHWSERYFEAVCSKISNDPVGALKVDSKYFELKGQPIKIGQLEVWDSSIILKDQLQNIFKHLNTSEFKGFVTIADISNGYNILICIDEDIRNILNEKLGVTFSESVCYTEKLYLRKELVKILSVAV